MLKKGGKRGRQGEQVNGFSLKCPNLDGKYYVYIWQEFDKKWSMEQRKRGNMSNTYSYCGGWKSIGRWGVPATMERLQAHLTEKYGTFDEEELLKEIEEDLARKEKKRLKKLAEKIESMEREIRKCNGYENFSADGMDLREFTKLFKSVLFGAS